MLMYDTNMFFAFIIGGLTFLAVHNFFFRKDGPWAKRNRLFALARVRSNQFRHKWNSGNHEESTALRSPAMIILVIVLITMLARIALR
jgi:hypothetical protein